MLAAMASMNEVTGAHNKFIIGMTAEIGFVGIAVAMLAQNNPLGIIPAAFLFAFLTKGASDLDLETQFISRDFAKILQGIIILSVVGFQFIKFDFLKRARNG
jgi:simple sugar transport system permease protein